MVYEKNLCKRFKELGRHIFLIRGLVAFRCYPLGENKILFRNDLEQWA